jgi:glycosyltransferase involved in cell wall biosynthesis
MTARPVRVLWLSKGLGPGGAERLLVEHASVGDRDACELEAAYLLPWKQHLVPELEALGVRAHCLGVRHEGDPRWLVRLLQLVRRGRFDVVHAHSPISASLARTVLRAAPNRPALVYTEHNRWDSYHLATRSVNRATFSLNDKVFAVSDDVRASMAPSLRTRVEVLQHGIDLDRVRAHARDRTAARAELGVPDDTVLVVTVANLREGKGYPYLLAAAKQILDARVPVRFVAVGQGQLDAEIRALLDELDLGDGFRLLGYRPDAVRIIAAADVFALASLHEGLPVAVMEALALGIPIVATDVGGLPEAVEPHVNGLLVPPRDPAALAEALQEMLDPQQRARLAAGARLAGARYASRLAVDRIEAEYRFLAGVNAASSTGG